MPEWLELELAHQLAPVKAPAALKFEGVPRRTPRRSFTLAPLLAGAAALALLLLAAPHQRTSPAEINRYFESEAGIALPIPSNTQAAIEKVGLVDREGMRVASVQYRAGGREARVLIARAATVRGPEWKPHGQIYAISYTDAQIACLLCHANL